MAFAQNNKPRLYLTFIIISLLSFAIQEANGQKAVQLFAHRAGAH